VDFIGRFLLHVLPKGFQKVRAYGWLAQRHKTATLAAIRAARAEPCAHAEKRPGLDRLTAHSAPIGTAV
jgi:hypothetical protein